MKPPKIILVLLSVAMLVAVCLSGCAGTRIWGAGGGGISPNGGISIPVGKEK